MSDGPPRKSFTEQLAELAKERGKTLEELTGEQTPQVDEDLIPDVLGDRSEQDVQVDQIIESIDILDAYRRWIGKEVDEGSTSRREGIMVSCPSPDHRDKHPSAWLNADKRTYFCGGCQEGGDVYDLAAIKFGYVRPDYKDGKAFHDLRREMAESYGWRFETKAGVEVVWQETESADSSAPLARGQSEEKLEIAPVIDLYPDLTEAPAVPVFPTIDWNNFVTEDTFLHQYLTQTTKDDCPEEYHFWHGLIALGHAVGRKVYVSDTRPVYGNLLVCLLGGTGYGKSRSRLWLDDVIKETLPYTDNGLDTTGCKLIPVPASGESLIKQFQHIAWDPSLPKGIPEVRTPINGIVDYDEFSGLLQRASRSGSTLKPIIMGFADSRDNISSSSITNGTMEAVFPFCSITASTQPRAIRHLLDKNDMASGFLNRWIFAGGSPKDREIMGGSYSATEVDLAEPIDSLKKIRGWGGVERKVMFTTDGLKVFEHFIRTEVYPIQDKDETDLLTRLDLIMKRLILLFCVNERTMLVSPEIVQRVEPILKFLIRSYEVLDVNIRITIEAECEDDILKYCRRFETAKGKSPTLRDITMTLKRKYPAWMLKREIEIMVAIEWIEPEKSTGRGRPTVRYKAVKQ